MLADEDEAMHTSHHQRADQSPSLLAPAGALHSASSSSSGSEERELYGSADTPPCPDCEGKGEYYGVTGDYAAGMIACRRCQGSGVVAAINTEP